MLAKRIIPASTSATAEVVKGVQFRNHEIIGDIVPLAKRYADEGPTNWCSMISPPPATVGWSTRAGCRG